MTDVAADAAAERASVKHRRSTVRSDKAEVVAELAEAFRTASAAVLTEYRGLSVKQVTALRVALGGDTSYAIVKNTLTRLAAADAGLEGLEALLTGPTAVAFINGEPVEAAKALRDYARANPALVVKGGVLDGKPLTADEIRKLADLQSREVLLARTAATVLASAGTAAASLWRPVPLVAGLLEAALHRLGQRGDEQPLTTVADLLAAPEVHAVTTADPGRDTSPGQSPHEREAEAFAGTGSHWAPADRDPEPAPASPPAPVPDLAPDPERAPEPEPPLPLVGKPKRILGHLLEYNLTEFREFTDRYNRVFMDGD